VFYDWGAAALLALFVGAHLWRPFKVKGREFTSGDLNVTFTVLLAVYVAFRVLAASCVT